MNNLLCIAGTTLTSTMLGITLVSPVHADTVQHIGFTGVVPWEEAITAIHMLQTDYGLPLADGCTPETTRCVTFTTYQNDDGAYGWYRPAEKTIALNTYYPQDPVLRLEVALHELGHALGLEHGPAGSSSMEEYVGSTGYYVLGFTDAELHTMRSNTQ